MKNLIILLFVAQIFVNCSSTDPQPVSNWSFSVDKTTTSPAFSGNFQLKEVGSKTYTIVTGGSITIDGIKYPTVETPLPELLPPDYHTTVELRSDFSFGEPDAKITFVGSFTDTQIKANGVSYTLRNKGTKDLPNFIISKQ